MGHLPRLPFKQFARTDRIEIGSTAITTEGDEVEAAALLIANPSTGHADIVSPLLPRLVVLLERRGEVRALPGLRSQTWATQTCAGFTSPRPGPPAWSEG